MKKEDEIGVNTAGTSDYKDTGTGQIPRLIVITRGDLNPGLIVAQSGHAISQFHLDYPDLAKAWNNNYLISLSINSKEKLESLLTKLLDMGIFVSYFCEPDISNELTSVCFLECNKTKKLTSSLRLSLETI